MKLNELIVLFPLLVSQLFANSISGEVGFQTPEGVHLKDFSITIGDPDHGRKYGFPDYLSGLSSRYSEKGAATVSKDGKFRFDKITLDQNKIIILKNPRGTYFKKIQISKDLPYIWNEVIKLPSENLKTVKVKVVNNVTEDFPLTYFIEDGNEGWVFSGKKNRETSMVTLNDVPDGIYNFVALTSAGDDKPNRVDSFRIEVSDNMPKEVVVEIDGEIGNTLRTNSNDPKAFERVKKPPHSNKVDPLMNQRGKTTELESSTKAAPPFPWWIIGIGGIILIAAFLFRKG